MTRLNGGERLEDELLARGMLQKDLAAAVGRTTGTISNWINNRNPPSPRDCDAIARALKLPANEVRGWFNQPLLRIPPDTFQPRRDARDVHAAFVRLRDAIQELEGMVSESFELTTRTRPVAVRGWVQQDAQGFWSVIEEQDAMPVQIAQSDLDGIEQAFALRVRGDGLEGFLIADGDLLLCEPVGSTRQPQDRELVIVRLHGYTTLARWIAAAAGGELVDATGHLLGCVREIGAEVEGIVVRRYSDWRR